MEHTHCPSPDPLESRSPHKDWGTNDLFGGAAQMVRGEETGSGSKRWCHVRPRTMPLSRPLLCKGPRETRRSFSSWFSWTQASLRGWKGSCTLGRGKKRNSACPDHSCLLFPVVETHPIGLNFPEFLGYVTWSLGDCSRSLALCPSLCHFLQVQK